MSSFLPSSRSGHRTPIECNTRKNEYLRCIKPSSCPSSFVKTTLVSTLSLSTSLTMKLLAPLTTVVAAVAAQGPGTIFTSCATPGTTEQTVANFMISAPYCAGHNYTLTSTGPLSGPIFEPAKLAITGKFLGRVIYADNMDMCPLLAEAGTPCPVATTVTSLSLQRLLKPSFPANVRYYFQACANLLFCSAMRGRWLLTQVA